MTQRPATLLLALLAGCAATARAGQDPWSGAPLPERRQETPSPITDHFYVEGSYFAPHLDTTLRIDPDNAGPGARGTTLSGERDLGLSTGSGQPRVELMIRMRTRHRIRVDYEEVDRTASVLLGRDLVFGNQLFLKGQLTNSELNWRIFTLTYTYSVVRNDRFELGTGIAAHLVEATAHGDVPSLAERQDVSGAGAFPTLPLDLTLRVTRHIVLAARGQYFRAHIGKFDGSLTQWRADLQYRLARNVTLGVGYASTRINLDVASTSFPGAFALDERGVQSFFRVSL